MLGSMQQGRYASASWLLAGIDFVSSALALAAIFILAGAQTLPALLIAPLAFAGAIAACGGYRRSYDELAGGSPRWVFRILAAGLFSWFAALLANGTGPEGLYDGAQLALWASTVLVSSLAREAAAPLLRRLQRPERWIVVGDEATTQELLTYAPLKHYASIVCEVKPASQNGLADPDRAFALMVVERHHADRVVIASREQDDISLLKLIGVFRAVGGSVSLLPAPWTSSSRPRPDPSGSTPCR